MNIATSTGKRLVIAVEYYCRASVRSVSFVSQWCLEAASGVRDRAEPRRPASVSPKPTDIARQNTSPFILFYLFVLTYPGFYHVRHNPS